MEEAVSLKQGYDLFIFDRESYCAPKTLRNYRQTINFFLEYMEQIRETETGNIALDTIAKDDVKAYMVYLRSKPKYEKHPFHTGEQGTIRKVSVKTYMVAVRALFNFLYREEYTPVDIFRNFKMIKPEARQIIPLTERDVTDIDSLFNPKTQMGSRNLCMFHLMLDAGLRISDVMNLRIPQVVFRDDILYVALGKGYKDRSVPLSPKLKKYLYTYQSIYRPMAEHDYFLCTVDGEQLTEDCIKSLFARVKKKTGLQRLYPHLLRHTFATSYMLGGGDLESLRIYMGHTDISTTQKYLHMANQNRVNPNIYKLDKKFFRRYAS